MNEIMMKRWRPILKCRSVKDKIGVVVDCELTPVGDLPIVAELVREGIIVWGDRIRRPYYIKNDDGSSRIVIAPMDVYYLTTKGIELCNAQGIDQH